MKIKTVSHLMQIALKENGIPCEPVVPQNGTFMLYTKTHILTFGAMEGPFAVDIQNKKEEDIASVTFHQKDLANVLKAALLIIKTFS